MLDMWTGSIEGCKGDEEGAWLGRKAGGCVEMHESMDKFMKTPGGPGT